MIWRKLAELSLNTVQTKGVPGYEPIKMAENPKKLAAFKPQEPQLFGCMIGKLWLPKVIYENTDQKETTRLGEYGKGEWETRVVVDRQGNFTWSRWDDAVDEIEIFKGAENDLLMSQTYTHEFQCSYDFSMYPFDTQV